LTRFEEEALSGCEWTASRLAVIEATVVIVERTHTVPRLPIEGRMRLEREVRDRTRGSASLTGPFW
jgi:hypothetical protein